MKKMYVNYKRRCRLSSHACLVNTTYHHHRHHYHHQRGTDKPVVQGIYQITYVPQ